MASMTFDPKDIQSNRTLGGLGYLIFFLPLICCKNSRFGRYCANQGLILLILYLAVASALAIVGSLLGWIPLLGGFIFGLLRFVRGLVTFVAVLAAIYYSYLAAGKGDARELPFVGHYTLIR